MTAPLMGVRVLEVGNFLAAPFCCMQLADLGADVVKVERPDGGDVVRSAAPFVGGESSTFVRLNRNKRSLALDLKADGGRKVFISLAGRADVIVENLAPGAMERLGLGDAALRAGNPGLVYASLSGFGQDGPYAELPGLDIIAQAMGGLMSITGEEGGPPVKVGVPVTDLTCGLYAALAVVSALYSRMSTGRGQFIDVSLFESAVSLAVWEAGEFFATGSVHGRLGTAHQRTAPYQAVRASDGSFCVGATSPSTWPAFCKVIGREDLALEDRYKTSSDRHARRDELIPEIEAVTVTRPAAEWVAAFNAVGVPAGPIRGYEEVFSDPHLLARGFFADAAHRDLGPLRQLGSPMRFSATPTTMSTAGPLLGEHSRPVLEELGIPPEEVERLLADGVVAAR